MYRITVGEHIIPNLVQEQELSMAELDGCHRSVAQANRALHPAAWLRTMADRYIDQFIGSRDFLCMHVRPYGDKCLDVSVSRLQCAGYKLSVSAMTGLPLPPASLPRAHCRLGRMARRGLGRSWDWTPATSFI
jgi:hypothetical protein